MHIPYTPSPYCLNQHFILIWTFDNFFYTILSFFFSLNNVIIINIQFFNFILLIKFINYMVNKIIGEYRKTYCNKQVLLCVVEKDVQEEKDSLENSRFKTLTNPNLHSKYIFITNTISSHLLHHWTLQNSISISCLTFDHIFIHPSCVIFIYCFSSFPILKKITKT